MPSACCLMPSAYSPRMHFGSHLSIAGHMTNRAWADDADDVVIIYADNLSDVDLGDLLVDVVHLVAGVGMSEHRASR